MVFTIEMGPLWHADHAMASIEKFFDQNPKFAEKYYYTG